MLAASVVWMSGLSLKAPQPLQVALPRAKQKLPNPYPSNVRRRHPLHPPTRLAAIVASRTPTPRAIMLHLCKSARLAWPSPALSQGGRHHSLVHGRVPSLHRQPGLVGVASLVHGAVGMAAMGSLRGEVAGCEHELASGVACTSAAGAAACVAPTAARVRGVWSTGAARVPQRHRPSAGTTRTEARRPAGRAQSPPWPPSCAGSSPRAGSSAAPIRRVG